ncbi:MAG: hypothetical protein IJO45_04195, partial [Oscillospiraceae bacterium]|nr:hypothetical protein [Oscillospiraceae bacterium]
MAAIIPTVVQLTAGASWISVLLVAVLSLLCIWFRWSFGAVDRGKAVSFIELVLLAPVLGT